VGAIKDDLDSGNVSTPTIGVLFGTHNWKSCGLILDELVKSGLARKDRGGRDQVVLGDDVTERLTIGQLYGMLCFVLRYYSLWALVLTRLSPGMSDELTNHLVHKTSSNTPLIIKYVIHSVC
jgi:proline dehydrogenase